MRWPWSKRVAPVLSRPEDVTCREIVRIVNDYLERALPPEQTEAVELHLNLCDGCSDYLAQLRLSIALTGELPAAAFSPELEEELCAAFRELPAMRAYKFLRAGRFGPFTGFVWEPGVWVEAPDATPCERGVHACRVEDLPFWTNDELWEVELEGSVVTAGRKLVAPRGRLAARVDAWSPAAAQMLADEAAARARSHADASPRDATARAYAEDAERRAGQGKAYAATYIASVAAEHAGGAAGRDAERASQADWFRRLLG